MNTAYVFFKTNIFKTKHSVPYFFSLSCILSMSVMPVTYSENKACRKTTYTWQSPVDGTIIALLGIL
jgi:hypothetical protein